MRGSHCNYSPQVPKNIATPLLGTSSSLTLKLDSDVLIIVSVAVNLKHLDITVYMYRGVIHSSSYLKIVCLEMHRTGSESDLWQVFIFAVMNLGLLQLW